MFRHFAAPFCALWVLAVPGFAATLTFTKNLPGTFIDISSTGTPLHLSGDLTVPIQSDVENAVFPEGTVYVGNNGGLGFRNPPSTFLAPVNQPLPSFDAFGGGEALLGFWDDIGNTVGHVYWQQMRDVLIIQWDHKPFEGSTDTLTFQFQIFDQELRGPIYAQMLYADVEQPRAGGGASATIGFQGGNSGFDTVQWSFNTPNSVDNGTVLSLIDLPEPATGLSACLVVALLRGRNRERRAVPA